MTTIHEQVWSKCMEIFRDNLQPATYKTWFEPIKPVKIASNVLTIQVPSPFFYEFLEDKYIDLLKKALYKELGPGAKLEYQVVVDQGELEGEAGTVNMPAHNGMDLKQVANIRANGTSTTHSIILSKATVIKLHVQQVMPLPPSPEKPLLIRSLFMANRVWVKPIWHKLSALKQRISFPTKPFCMLVPISFKHNLPNR
jgi:chromosomal replication initiation ATPase DnaA